MNEHVTSAERLDSLLGQVSGEPVYQWVPGPACPKCKKGHMRKKIKGTCSYEVATGGCTYSGPITGG